VFTKVDDFSEVQQQVLLSPDHSQVPCVGVFAVKKYKFPVVCVFCNTG
jgi:hypothetical protein